MLRYITAASIAGLLLAVAIKSRGSAQGTPPAPSEPSSAGLRPEVVASRLPEGVDLKVRQRFVGAVSRAKLVYEYGGRERILDQTTSCKKSLDKLVGDGFSHEVNLRGRLPHGYSGLKLVVEDETGVRVVPVEFELD